MQRVDHLESACHPTLSPALVESEARLDIETLTAFHKPRVAVGYNSLSYKKMVIPLTENKTLLAMQMYN